MQLDNIMLNTLRGLRLELAKQTCKAIAKECAIMETQVSDDHSKSIFARLSDCKTRKEFCAVFDSVM